MNILAPPTSAEAMRFFDALPDRIRLAIAQADFAYDPREIAERLANGRRIEAVARAIETRRTAR